MENYQQEPSESTHTQNETVVEACSIDMAQAISDRTFTLCSRHDYEEVMLAILGTGAPELTRDHVYDEPDETEPPVSLTEARGYEEPVKRSWKRLSLPSMDDSSPVPMPQMRRNSSASELHNSGNDFKAPRAVKPSRILHYAEFSLYPANQTGPLSSVSEATTGTPSSHRVLTSRPSKEPHEYEEPSFPTNNLQHPPCPIPAPLRLLSRGSVSDYEIPVVTSPPLLRNKSSQSMMRQVKLKLHHLSTNMNGGNINDEEVRLIESESDGRDDSSDLLKSPGNEVFSSQDSNVSHHNSFSGCDTFPGYIMQEISG